MSFKILTFGQIAKLVASRNHMAGFDLSHELFRAAYDIAFYSGSHINFHFSLLDGHIFNSNLLHQRILKMKTTRHWQHDFGLSTWYMTYRKFKEAAF